VARARSQNRVARQRLHRHPSRNLPYYCTNLGHVAPAIVDGRFKEKPPRAPTESISSADLGGSQGLGAGMLAAADRPTSAKPEAQSPLRDVVWCPGAVNASGEPGNTRACPPALSRYEQDEV
jgi:hypothetical protein